MPKEMKRNIHLTGFEGIQAGCEDTELGKGAKMTIKRDFLVLTDIGSTTTKALLLDIRSDPPVLLGMTHAPTTVEEPHNDVRHGIIASVRALEDRYGLRLLAAESGQVQLRFTQNIAYFSTSSAGGGLQILVIGLTMFDSASSGKRCAYGAGGVILDTFALDDKRQAMEQMLAMRNLHPDMILLCGGTDGGAVSGVLRMAEIVRIANPAPKFSTSDKIPTLYAGNHDAAPIIQKLISDSFDLHILPNLRPSLSVENLQPTQDKIQQLFMENVMEHAPGYSEVKPAVAAGILPTPVGVHKALALLADKDQRNIFAFDIGGATTDVLSFIHSHFQRTVSANLGMSYSAWNVLRESGPERILRWLPDKISEVDLRNYIANKCLHPTSNPVSTMDFRIEHALAREALALAFDQHRQMHYNGAKLGFLDKIKQGEVDKYEQIFEYQREEAKYNFSASDIDVLIGAGGIFAHAQNHAQCALILAEAIQPKGITELWIDRHFISPQLGVLSDSEPGMAKQLLESEGIERLALHIAPLFPARTRKPILDIEIVNDSGNRQLQVLPDAFYYLPAGPKTLKIAVLNQAKLSTSLDLDKISTKLPVIVDTRLAANQYSPQAEQAVNAYAEDDGSCGSGFVELQLPQRKAGEWLRSVELPYSGDINFQVGDRVRPDDVVAVNRYNPPRLFIVSGFQKIPGLSPQQIAAALHVQVGESLDFDQNYATLPPEVELPYYLRSARRLISPIAGKIEYIDPNTGIMVVSEIQDYSSKPVKVNYAEALGLSPKLAKRYLLRQLGDFVYRNELLAKRIERNAEGHGPQFVKAPSTGTVTAIDMERGILTLSYLHKPLEFPSHVQGTVTQTRANRSLAIAYEGTRLEGRIAFGRDCHGKLIVLQKRDELRDGDARDCIAVLAFPPTEQDLKELAAKGARAVVCFELDASGLVAWLGFEPGVINTGNESLPLTVMILSGFGSRPMPAVTQALLADRDSCYINPHTRIRSGVVRPYLAF